MNIIQLFILKNVLVLQLIAFQTVLLHSPLRNYIIEAGGVSYGELNAKYPSGMEVQKEKLEAEGHTIMQRGRTNIKYYVKDFEDNLFELE